MGGRWRDWWFAPGNADRMDLPPEQKEYEPGEKACFQVRSPFRSATALVTIEREGVLESFVTRLSGRNPVIEVPIGDSYAPNVYVSVLAVRGRVAGWRAWLADLVRRLGLPWRFEGGAATALADLSKPAFRLGVAQIRVGWSAQRLQVRVTPTSETYRVRDKAIVDVQVRGPNGRPLPAGAELAFAAVDEGLLELRPNESWALLDAMMNERPIEVWTSTAQMQVVGKRHYGRKAVPTGGGGGRAGARELFDTLLLWRGRVKVDSAGRARIEVPLNDSLTSFRLVAVASAGDEYFGTGHATHPHDAGADPPLGPDPARPRGRPLHGGVYAAQRIEAPHDRARYCKARLENCLGAEFRDSCHEAAEKWLRANLEGIDGRDPRGWRARCGLAGDGAGRCRLACVDGGSSRDRRRCT